MEGSKVQGDEYVPEYAEAYEVLLQEHIWRQQNELI
jgi:hypothetical protein